jgi:hypothetical protein
MTRTYEIIVPKDKREGGSYRAAMTAFENAILSHVDRFYSVNTDEIYRDARGQAKARRVTLFQFECEENDFASIKQTASVLFPSEATLVGAL